MPCPVHVSRLALRAALAALAATGMLGGAAAHAESRSVNSGSASASVIFAIHIPPVLRVKADAPTLRITSQDLARGYVETSVPQEVRVVRNTGGEYALRIELRLTRFNRVTISEQQVSQSFGTEGLTLHRPRTSAGVIDANYRFNYRFELPPDLPPGDYPWPLAVSLVQV